MSHLMFHAKHHALVVGVEDAVHCFISGIQNGCVGAAVPRIDERDVKTSELRNGCIYDPLVVVILREDSESYGGSIQFACALMHGNGMCAEYIVIWRSSAFSCVRNGIEECSSHVLGYSRYRPSSKSSMRRGTATTLTRSCNITESSTEVDTEEMAWK